MNYQWTTVFSLTLTKINKNCNKCIVHCSLMLVNTLMKSHCIVLPYKTIGLQTGYVYLHRCMCRYITFHQNQVQILSFWPANVFFPVITATTEAVRASHLRFHELAGYTVFCRNVGAQFFSLIWLKYHIIKDSVLRTSYSAVTRQQMLLINKKH